MADGLKLEVRGLKKTLRALKDFDGREQKKIVSGPLNAGASLINKEAKRRIKSTDIAISKSIGIRAKTYSQSGVIARIIGPRVYTKPVKSQGGKYVSSREATIRAKQREFGQAGVRMVPFMRPAFRSKKNEALTKISTGIKIQITKAVLKRKTKA